MVDRVRKQEIVKNVFPPRIGIWRTLEGGGVIAYTQKISIYACIQPDARGTINQQIIIAWLSVLLG